MIQKISLKFHSWIKHTQKTVQIVSFHTLTHLLWVSKLHCSFTLESLSVSMSDVTGPVSEAGVCRQPGTAWLSVYPWSSSHDGMATSYSGLRPALKRTMPTPLPTTVIQRKPCTMQCSTPVLIIVLKQKSSKLAEKGRTISVALFAIQWQFELQPEKL